MNGFDAEPELPDNDPDIIAGLRTLAKLRASEAYTPELTIAPDIHTPPADHRS